MNSTLYFVWDSILRKWVEKSCLYMDFQISFGEKNIYWKKKGTSVGYFCGKDNHGYNGDFPYDVYHYKWMGIGLR